MLQRNISLKPFNTFGVESTADALGRFSTTAELRTLLRETEGTQRLILGGGSNILLTRDFHGSVLLNELPGIDVVKETAEQVTVKAGAGTVWHALVMHCVGRGWGGIENMSLIPGKVGAAPMQNIGAYGVELKDVFVELEALRISDHEVQTFNAAQCAFGYRESFFKREGKDRFVILSVTLQLNKKAVMNTSYGNIQQELEKHGITSPSIADVSNAVIAIRRSKLPDPAVVGNAGSFFKNPVVPVDVVENIRRTHPNVPNYPGEPGTAKVPAGWLIEQAGWKGYREGAFGVHDKQALVLVNHGGAAGGDIHRLSGRIIADIQEKFGIELEREVNIL